MMRRLLCGLGFTIGAMVAVVVSAAAVLVQTGHLQMQPVLSGSMRPSLQPGDLALTWRVPVSSLHVGDVIVFYPPGTTTPVLHRIARISRVRTLSQPRTVITTAGDANHGRIDPWGRITVRSAHVFRLAGNVPNMGWARTLPLGVIQSVLLIAAGLLLLSILADLVRHPDKSSRHPASAAVKGGKDHA